MVSHYHFKLNHIYYHNFFNFYYLGVVKLSCVYPRRNIIIDDIIAKNVGTLRELEIDPINLTLEYAEKLSLTTYTCPKKCVFWLHYGKNKKK